MKKGPLVAISQVRGSTIVCINYLAGIKPYQLDRAMEQCKEMLASMVPVVIVCKDKIPPLWALPIVQGFCKHATRISVDTRQDYPKSCVVVVARNTPWSAGKRHKNPDSDWAALVGRHSHAVKVR
jgi:hypothetical protein